MTNFHSLTDDADLHLIANRRLIRPRAGEAADSGTVWFALPAPVAEIRIVSRSLVPAALGAGEDVRRLGILLRRVLLRTPSMLVEVDATEPRLVDGFWPIEDGQRWTNGDARLPPVLFDWIDRPFELGLETAQVPIHYPLRHRRALVIDATTPTPDRDAGSNVALWHMRLLQDLGFAVSFIPQDNFTFIPGYTPALHRRGIATVEGPRYREVAAFLRDHGRAFDLVYLHRWAVAEHCLAALRAHAPHLPVLFNNADLHFLRMKREAALTNSAERAAEAEVVRERELAVIAAADCTLLCNSEELVLLQAMLPQAPLHYLPWVTEPRDDPAPGWDARAGLMFLGGFGHAPNVDAALWFVGEVMPLVREVVPELRLHIYGASITPTIEALASDAVVVGGHVPQLGPVFDRHRMLVAPLRYGAGFKGKIAEALAYGLPVVASTVAAEGTGLRHDHELLVAPDAATFAAAIVRLEREHETWERLSGTGLAHVRTAFSPARGKAHFVEVLQAIGRDDLLTPG